MKPIITEEEYRTAIIYPANLKIYFHHFPNTYTKNAYMYIFGRKEWALNGDQLYKYINHAP